MPASNEQGSSSHGEPRIGSVESAVNCSAAHGGDVTRWQGFLAAKAENASLVKEHSSQAAAHHGSASHPKA